MVEPEEAKEPFLTENPYQRYVRGDVNRVALITGTMRDEAISPAGCNKSFYFNWLFEIFGYETKNSGIILAILRDSVATEELDRKWNEVAPLLYLYDFLNVTTEVRDNISQAIRRFYFGDKPVGNATFSGILESITDSGFVLGAYEEAILLSRHAPVYQYVNTFEGDYSFGSAGLGLNYTGKLKIRISDTNAENKRRL